MARCGILVLLLPLLAGCLSDGSFEPVEAGASDVGESPTTGPPAHDASDAVPRPDSQRDDAPTTDEVTATQWTGFVLATNGTPIFNATVRYAPFASDKSSWDHYRTALGNLTNVTATTDDSGQFSLPFLAGLARLSVRHDSFLPRFFDVRDPTKPVTILLTPHPGTLIVAHRGASAVAPENTMAAFREAILAGADVLELDVRQTADGALIVLHDFELSRTTDGEGLVATHTLAEIQALDAGSWFGPEHAGERVPTLGEVLRLAKEEGIRLVLDVKGAFRDNSTDAVYHESTVMERAKLEVMEAGLGTFRVMFTTFDYVDAHRCPSGSPVRCGWVVDRDYILDGATDNVRVGGVDARLVHHAELTPERVQDLRSRNGLEVYAYTVLTAKRMDQLVEMGVDGIVANDPGLLFERVERFAFPAA